MVLWLDQPSKPSTTISLVKIGEKLKEEFVHNETRSFPYLLDMAVTVKVARTRTE